MREDTDAQAGADVLTALGGFARTLRAAGVPVTPDRTTAFVQACLAVGVDDRSGVYWAGRSTLCGDPEHLRPYDLAFEAWFGGRLARSRPASRDPRPRAGRATRDPRPRPAPVASLGDGVREGAGQSERDDLLRAAASGTEVLRH